VEQLKDLYSAEKQIMEALPKLAKKATSPKLKKAFEDHLAQTEEQFERIKQIGEDLDLKLSGHTCKAIEGIIKEGKELMEEDAEESVMDAGLIAAAQRVEHYEIAAYGTVCTFAKQLGHTEALKLLKKTLGEEKATDEKLTAIAETTVNLQAEKA
jgi:ferritin-like metal-binding protein YciE